MNTTDKYDHLISNIKSSNHRNLLYAFLLLQVYFTSNILSFALWKSSVPIIYLIGFYGTWILILLLLLFLVLLILPTKAEI